MVQCSPRYIMDGSWNLVHGSLNWLTPAQLCGQYRGGCLVQCLAGELKVVNSILVHDSLLRRIMLSLTQAEVYRL